MKKKKKQKKEVDHQKQDSVTQKLAEELLANSEQPRQNDLTKRLQDLLMELGVKPSIKKGLIDPMELELCGDGSSIAIMDAGHDAMGNYFYFRQKDIPALIPLTDLSINL